MPSGKAARPWAPASSPKSWRKRSEESIMREVISMACTLCKRRNYSTMKNKKNDPDRLERNKFCRFCRKHTSHKEVK